MELEEVAQRTGSRRKAECCHVGAETVAALNERRPTFRRHKGSLSSATKKIQTSCRSSANIFSSCRLRIRGFRSWGRIGVVTPKPMFPVLYQPKQKWQFPELGDTRTLLDEAAANEVVSRTNCASVIALLEDEAEFGLVVTMTEEQVQKRPRYLVVMTYKVFRIDEPHCVLTSRVLFDGSNGSTVNTQTYIGDQELAPVGCHFGLRELTGIVVSVVSDITHPLYAPVLRLVVLGLPVLALWATEKGNRRRGALAGDLRVTAVQDSAMWQAPLLHSLRGSSGPSAAQGGKQWKRKVDHEENACSATVGRVCCSGSDAGTVEVRKTGIVER